MHVDEYLKRMRAIHFGAILLITIVFVMIFAGMRPPKGPFGQLLTIMFMLIAIPLVSYRSRVGKALKYQCPDCNAVNEYSIINNETTDWEVTEIKRIIKGWELVRCNGCYSEYRLEYHRYQDLAPDYSDLID